MSIPESKKKELKEALAAALSNNQSTGEDLWVFRKLIDLLNKANPGWVYKADYDWYAALVTQFIKAEQALPEPLGEFTIHVIETRGRRGKPGPSRYKNLDREASIVSCVFLAVSDLGLNPYRNDETPENIISACDLVSDCLKELGHTVPYKTVADYWRRRPKYYNPA